ncbi:hypothetical protein HMPREF0992_02053 [Lachnospiraceae bacterium 6_1_63FAA]|nr:hypothetical protein HMPREF0992_02053 [Lachnospiraceae bacterium 6_1_63FAA]
MRVKRRIVEAVIILLCFILQGTVFQALSIGSITPNLLLIITVAFGFMQGKLSGLWIGFFCGILQDVFLRKPFRLLCSYLSVHRLCCRLLL